MIDAILTNTMLPEMSVELLERRMRGDEVTTIAVDVTAEQFSYAFTTKAVRDLPSEEFEQLSI